MQPDDIARIVAGLTPEQKELARHALGLNYKRKSFRNRFVTGKGSLDYEAWMAMVKDGFATRRAGNELTGGDDLFILNVRGAVAALNDGEKLCREDFDPIAVRAALKERGA